MGRDIHVLLEETTSKIIMKLKPKLFCKYIWLNKSRNPMIYVKLKKGLYGTLQAAVLVWRLVTNTKIEWGLVLQRLNWWP